MMTQFVPRYMYMSFDYITGYDVIEKHYRLGGGGGLLASKYINTATILLDRTCCGVIIIRG